jgi:glycosyltransferase involved in cell wall biosynthesis
MTRTAADWPPDVFVLIPAFKAAQSLVALLPRLLSAVPSSNVLVVDDASGDATPEACRRHELRCLVHPVNRGKGAALSSGFRYIIDKFNARRIITMDADGQHAVEDLPLFLEYDAKNPSAGICIGARSLLPWKMPPGRVISNTLTSMALSMICGVKIPDSQSGFRMYSSEMLRRFSCRFQRFEMESEILMRAAHGHFSIGFVRVQTLYLNRESHILHFRDTLRWLRAVASVRSELHSGNTR